jgi:hypothetical protein
MLLGKIQHLFVVLIDVAVFVAARAVQEHRQRQVRLAIPVRRDIEPVGFIRVGVGEMVLAVLIALGLPLRGAWIGQRLRPVSEPQARHGLGVEQRAEGDRPLLRDELAAGSRRASGSAAARALSGLTPGCRLAARSGPATRLRASAGALSGLTTGAGFPSERGRAAGRWVSARAGLAAHSCRAARLGASAGAGLPTTPRAALVPPVRRAAMFRRTRRPAGKARRGRILDVCNRGATQPAGMDRVGRRLASPAQAHRGRVWEPSQGSHGDRTPKHGRNSERRHTVSPMSLSLTSVTISHSESSHQPSDVAFRAFGLVQRGLLNILAARCRRSLNTAPGSSGCTVISMRLKTHFSPAFSGRVSGTSGIGKIELWGSKGRHLVPAVLLSRRVKDGKLE